MPRTITFNYSGALSNLTKNIRANIKDFLKDKIEKKIYIKIYSFFTFVEWLKEQRPNELYNGFSMVYRIFSKNLSHLVEIHVSTIKFPKRTDRLRD